MRVTRNDMTSKTRYPEPKTAGQPDSAVTITAIRYRKKSRHPLGVCAVELDGEPWADIDPEIVVSEGLKAGASLSAMRLREVALADETLQARRAAASRCAMRRRSHAELSRHLRERGFGSAAAERALAQLTESGTVDDLEVARRHLRKRTREGGYGRRRIEAEMRRLGLEEAAIERAFSEGESDGDPDAETCGILAARRAGRYRPLEDPDNRRKLIAFLCRRGFAQDIAERAICDLESGADATMHD